MGTRKTPPIPDEKALPTMCRNGAEADRIPVFRQLRDLWCARYPEANITDLAAWLGVVRQRVSQWSTGVGGKGQPPWWACQKIAWHLDLVFVLDETGIAIHRKPS